MSDCVDKILCDILNELKQLGCLLQVREQRDTKIISFVIPEVPTISAPTREFQVGDTSIDFKKGIIKNPDNTLERLKNSFDIRHITGVKLRSITLESNKDVILTLKGEPEWSTRCKAGYSTNVSDLEFEEIRITTNDTSNINIFVCTNPAALVSVFSTSVVSVTVEQSAITGDSTEAQSWDTVTSLLNNLNRIRKKINDIIGGTNWYDAPASTIAALFAKFHATTGHVHAGTGSDAPKVPWANVDKTTSSIADITTKSHTTLSDIGTNTHAQIDTAITNSTTHIAATTGVHGAVATATADKIMIRDAAGRCAVVAPSASTDIALKSTVTDDIATHAAVTATHGATGAVVGTTNSQTLQNKTIDNTNIVTIHDHDLTLQDEIDTTKQAQFQCSGITTGTTRTYTLPNKSVTLAAIDDITTDIATHAALTATHGVTGAIVGTTDSQTLSNKINQLSILPADHSCSGDIINDTVGEIVALFDVLYLKSDGKWWKADADAAATMPGAALALGAIDANNAGNLLLRGFARDDTWTWTVGGMIYVSVTPGNPTQTAPSGTGDQVQILGFAKTADVIYFNPSYDIVEIV